MSTAACAMRDHWLNAVPDDGDEGSAMVGYSGTLITVYYTIHSGGIDIDGIEHAGLTLIADDISEAMRESLVRSLRAQFDSEADYAPL
jgi:hypothetical protein